MKYYLRIYAENEKNPRNPSYDGCVRTKNQIQYLANMKQEYYLNELQCTVAL
jgi:hypothetical protein